MKEAFKMAGVMTLEDRMEQIIDAALESSPGDFAGVVQVVFAAVIEDRLLLIRTFQDHAAAILGPLIRNRMAEKSAARGQLTTETHCGAAARNHPASAGSRPGQLEYDPQMALARSASIPSKDGGGGLPTAETQRATAPAINPPRVPTATIARLHRDLLLDKLMPNGKRFRDCTKAELEEMGRSLGRDAHRCTAVAAQLTSPKQTPDDAGITETELRRVDAAWNGE